MGLRRTGEASKTLSTAKAASSGSGVFPPTDFLNYGQPGEDAVGVGILKDFKATSDRIGHGGR
jgi:hypothetical protein